MEALSYKPITKDQWRLHAQSFDLNGLSPFDGKKVFYAAQRYVYREGHNRKSITLSGNLISGVKIDGTRKGRFTRDSWCFHFFPLIY